MLRKFTPTCLLVLFSLLLLSSCQDSEADSVTEARRPNVVVILADDQGWGDLGMNGNPVVSTPNIDALARNGAILDHFYVSAVCSPTRAELLTGRYAVRGGVYSTSEGGERLDLDETTFAALFQEAGYATAAFGKWHSGMQAPYHPNSRGFDEFYGYCSGHWGSYFDAMLEHNGKLVLSEGFLTDVLTDRTMAFIDEHQEEPFLAYLPLNTPHSPMQVPDKWWKKFENMPLPAHRYSDREKADHTRAAYAMAENIDWNVGRIMHLLDSLELTENTIVIYLSDNGPNGWRWNGGMEGIKGSTDEGGLRSPFVMQWTGQIAAGTHIPQIASAIDLLPTLLELAEVKGFSGKPIDGRSLKPLLIPDGRVWGDRVLASHWNGSTTIRSQDFRLDGEGRLFHMAEDPGQREDVSAKFPDVAASLRRAQTEWERNVLSELPAKDLRTFPVGNSSATYTQLPARDGKAHGSIERSNRWPNCSFFTHWTQEEDYVSWEVEVLENVEYEAIVYYTCDSSNLGALLELSDGMSAISARITEPNDPTLRGMEHDRILREESYVKDFRPLSLGKIQLSKGIGTLRLQATVIPGETALDFWLLMLVRQSEGYK